MRENRLKAKWRRGEATVGGWLSIPSTYSAEMMAHQGFDSLCVDMQHGMIDYADAVRMMTAVSTTDTVPIVRVPWNDPAMIMKVLDAGAYGVIVPLVNNRAEAELAVSACRYPPEGIRSNGANRAILYAGADYVAQANREIACLVMIETREALENLDDIMSDPLWQRGVLRGEDQGRVPDGHAHHGRCLSHARRAGAPLGAARPPG